MISSNKQLWLPAIRFDELVAEIYGSAGYVVVCDQKLLPNFLVPCQNFFSISALYFHFGIMLSFRFPLVFLHIIYF